MTIKSGNGGQIFKAIIKPEEMEKALICSYKSGTHFVCLNYDINSYSFGEFQAVFDSSKQCGYLGGSLIMEYFPETGQFIVGCVGNHIEYHLSQFSSELNFVKLINTTEAVSSESLLRINIVLPSGETKYQMLASTSVNQEPILIEIQLDAPTQSVSTTTLVCDIYYNYDHTECLTDIPTGFYCNNTDEKTIDKCHINCQTCDKGGDDNSNNCLTCKNGLYFNLGNCVERNVCTNGVFIDGSINKCRCIEDNKCLLCNGTSLASSKCLNCNTELYYYPKQEEIDNNNVYIFCYNNQSIGNGFYLNDEHHYEQCFETCLNCDELGNSADNKCTECKSGYSKIKNNNNIENCYPNCQNYFYFKGNNEYACLDSNNCPENYKLIEGKKKCIDDCSNEQIYNKTVEYNNVCYNSCPEYTKIVDSSNICTVKSYDGYELHVRLLRCPEQPANMSLSPMATLTTG